jgi:hypothetical protein
MLRMIAVVPVVVPWVGCCKTDPTSKLEQRNHDLRQATSNLPIYFPATCCPKAIASNL